MLVSLALRDLWFDKIMSACAAFALVAVITPLLILFSLNYGIVSTLEKQLADNPQNLELTMMQGYSLDAKFFDRLKNNPHVAFYVPLTRSLSVTADLKAPQKVKTAVDTAPTAAGDPLLAYSGLEAPNDGEMVLSYALADYLKAQPGDEIRLYISRTRGGKTERASETLKVSGILDKAVSSRTIAYVSLNVLTAMEDYRDGFDPALFSDGSNLNTVRQSYAKARIYAKGLDDVAPLAATLRDSGYNIRDKEAEIENVKAISSVLDFLFTRISWASIFGGAAALIGLIFSNIGRKEGAYALLQLMGFSRMRVTALVVIENLIIGSAAFLVSFGIYKGISDYFNGHFGQLLSDGAVVSELSPEHIFNFFGGTLSVCLLISFLCAIVRFATITMDVALREVK